MTKHFIKNIEIKDFKCFDKFKTEGFKRVNLISGKNNVGKTALMEAIWINVHSKNIKTCITSLGEVIFMRENINILTKSLKVDLKKFIEKNDNIFVKSNINQVFYKINDNDGEKNYIFEFNNKKIEKNINNFSFEIENIKNTIFVDNFGLSDKDIIENYSATQTKEKESYLDKVLNYFDSSIESFKIIKNTPSCKINGKYLKLTELGDGTKHLVSVVTSLHACENGYLFIDEIDNGIHYTQLDNIWEIILKVSKELNVQIFATTHSKECIDSYARVAKKLEDEDITFVELGKKNNEIKAMVYPYKWFLDEIDQNHEVRGW